eukprot:39426_1
MTDKLITTTVDGHPLIANSKYILVLGGGSKLAIYIAEATGNYSSTKIECIHLRTKHCLQHGHKKYTNHFKLRHITLIGVCPLTDSLIPFADAMNALLHLPHNNSKTSQCRRNKALMHRTISQATHPKDEKKKLKQYVANFINKSKRVADVEVLDTNEESRVRHAEFFQITDFLTSKGDFEDQMKSHDLEYPIVIKPPTSGGTEGVRLCYTFEAAQKVVKKYLFEENSEKNTNASMMCQEFLDGDEYVVNTVSFGSAHKVSDVWRAHKTFIVDKTMSKAQNIKDDDDMKHSPDDDKHFPYSMLYDYQELVVDLRHDNMKRIVDYVFSVLDILGVAYGCGHTEVIHLRNSEVCLVELNARCGGGIPRATDVVGYDQYALAALSYIDADRFVKEIPRIYHCKSSDDDDSKENGMESTVRVIFCQSQVNGRIEFNKLEELKKLKTFEKFAREFVYVGMEIWMKYHVRLLLMEQKLKHCWNMKEQTFAQMDYMTYPNINEVIDELEQQEDDCNVRMRSFRKTIGRIEKIERTVDLISSPGAIVLKGRLCDIETDYHSIRELEKDTKTGIFIDGTHTIQAHVDSEYINMMAVYELIQQGFTLSEARVAVQLSLTTEH